jgi:hypothetical protein
MKLYLGLNGPVISDGADPCFSLAIQAQTAGESLRFPRDMPSATAQKTP